MLKRTTNLEVLGKVVFPVEAEHAFSLHAVVGIALQRDADVGTSIDDTLVKDGHLTRRIVDRIVGAFGQNDTTGSHHHRALRHIVGSQRNDVG